MFKRKCGLVGLYVLTYDAATLVEWQGQITAVDGDDVIVSLCGWGSGYSNGAVGILKRSELYERGASRRVRLFDDADCWREAGSVAFARSPAAASA
jgi:hypothetical protein